MNWDMLRKIKKFTSIQEITNNYGEPKFKLATRPVFYFGNGFLVSYTTRKFKIEGGERIEYGEEGEYALSIYFFRKKKDLELYFKLKLEKYDFEGDILGGAFQIIEDIVLESTFKEVRTMLHQKENLGYYQEGETMALNEGNFSFQNRYIMRENYVLLFFGKTQSTKLSAFEYILND